VNATDTIPRVEPSPPAVAPKSAFGALLGGSILIVIGGLWALDLAGAVELKVSVVLSSVLIVIGLALLIGAVKGPHSGLVVAGLFLSIAVVIAGVVPSISFSGGVGERQVRVTEQSSLAATYEIALGDLSLDFGDLVMSESAVVSVSAGAGNVVVTLPPSVPVSITASTGAGEVVLLGQRSNGISVTREYESEGFDTAEITLTLDIDVAAGRIEVSR
jgi:hypothetical protein